MPQSAAIGHCSRRIRGTDTCITIDTCTCTLDWYNVILLWLDYSVTCLCDHRINRDNTGMGLRNKTTSELRTVSDSPCGVPISQVSLYLVFTVITLRTWVPVTFSIPFLLLSYYIRHKAKLVCTTVIPAERNLLWGEVNAWQRRLM